MLPIPTSPVSFGLRVRTVRKKRSLSLKALGELCGCSKGRLSAIENGHTLPGIPTIERIAMALGIAPQELAWGEDTTSQPARTRTDSATRGKR